MPRIAPLRKMFSRPGQLGVEAGADFQQAADAARACRRSRSVGSVMRERIFSSVLLPAPLRPMMPTTSPRLDLEVELAQRPEHVVGRGDVLLVASRIGHSRCSGRSKPRMSWPECCGSDSTPKAVALAEIGVRIAKSRMT